MKKSKLFFEKYLSNVPSEVIERVGLNIDIANKIYDILKAKNMTQRRFAELMGKKESEISRWLTGSYGFTTNTLAKIATVLEEPIVEVYPKTNTEFVFIPLKSSLYVESSISIPYTNSIKGSRRYNYHRYN